MNDELKMKLKSLCSGKSTEEVVEMLSASRFAEQLGEVDLTAFAEFILSNCGG